MTNGAPSSIDPVLLVLLRKSNVFAFNYGIRLINQRLMEEMERDGIKISPREFWILMCATERSFSQSGTAKILEINQNVMVRHIDALEKRGLVKRVPDPKNRRENQLRVTEKGKHLLEEAYKQWEERTGRIFHPIPLEQVTQMKELVISFIESHFSIKTQAAKPEKV